MRSVRRSHSGLIQGFLELVGNPSGNENSESYELQSLKLEQAGKTAQMARFCSRAVFGNNDRYIY